MKLDEFKDEYNYAPFDLLEYAELIIDHLDINKDTFLIHCAAKQYIEADSRLEHTLNIFDINIG